MATLQFNLINSEGEKMQFSAFCPVSFMFRKFIDDLESYIRNAKQSEPQKKKLCRHITQTCQGIDIIMLSVL